MTFKKIACLLACSLLIGFCFFAQKALCLPFWDAATNYTLVGTPPNAVGNLGGMTNVEGNIWGKTFGGPSALDVQVVNYPMTYAGLECSASNSFLFGFAGTNSFTDRIAVNPPVTGTNPYTMTSGTIYYSFIFTVPALGGDTTGGFFCGFNNTVGNQAPNPTIVGARLYVFPSGGGYQLGIGKAPATVAAATYSPILSLQSTNFVVCSYTFNPGTTNDDVAQMWLNPNPANFGAAVAPSPDYVNTSGQDITGVQSFLFRQGNVQVPEVYASDLRIGFCWACVTPPASITNSPPEAAALSISNVSTNQAVVSFQTNTPCFKFMTTTNLTSPSTNWTMVITNGIPLVGTNFVVTNTVPSVVSGIITNVVGGVTNKTTNTFLPPTYYQVKTYNN